jgi:hypothetical protein
MQRSTLLSLDDMPATTSLELDLKPVEAPRPVQFGNLRIRPVDETPPVVPQETLDISCARACPKCSFNASMDDVSCPKCGVIFAKMRFDAPRAVEPIHLDVGMEENTSTVELRVLSIAAALTFMALVFTSTLPTFRHADHIVVAGVFQVLAFIIWFGARAWDWGVSNGALGVVVLFFTTGWLWPLISKPIAWLAALFGVNFPLITGWLAMALAIAASVVVASVG